MINNSEIRDIYSTYSTFGTQTDFKSFKRIVEKKSHQDVWSCDAKQPQ